MKIHIIILITCLFSGIKNYSSDTDRSTIVSDYSFLKEGDIIFQVSLSGQGKAIQLATGSSYTHVGMIFLQAGKWMVIEAVQPVKWTPLEKFISHGQNDHYVVKRLKKRDAILNHHKIKEMKIMADKFAGINYDIYFDWSDRELYCSELVWKIYERVTGIRISELQKMKDFDLSSEEVKKKLKERFGDKIPLEENVISPAAIFESELLEEIKK